MAAISASLTVPDGPFCTGCQFVKAEPDGPHCSLYGVPLAGTLEAYKKCQRCLEVIAKAQKLNGGKDV